MRKWIRWEYLIEEIPEHLFLSLFILFGSPVIIGGMLGVAKTYKVHLLPFKALRKLPRSKLVYFSEWPELWDGAFEMVQRRWVKIRIPSQRKVYKGIVEGASASPEEKQLRLIGVTILHEDGSQENLPHADEVLIRGENLEVIEIYEREPDLKILKNPPT